MPWYPGLQQHIELQDQYLIFVPLHYCEDLTSSTVRDKNRASALWSHPKSSRFRYQNGQLCSATTAGSSTSLRRCRFALMDLNPHPQPNFMFCLDLRMGRASIPAWTQRSPRGPWCEVAEFTWRQLQQPRFFLSIPTERSATPWAQNRNWNCLQMKPGEESTASTPATRRGGFRATGRPARAQRLPERARPQPRGCLTATCRCKEGHCPDCLRSPSCHSKEGPSLLHSDSSCCYCTPAFEQHKHHNKLYLVTSVSIYVKAACSSHDRLLCPFVSLWRTLTGISHVRSRQPLARRLQISHDWASTALFRMSFQRLAIPMA